ncbi:MAG: type II toxin-antitoxin system prevent-host-death family antitoxin [Pseudaminobacter sp.]|nr:type II toxin-antitoxin system prevent-host-death family antitoxin [Pseudaminobacter sp.]
MYRINLEDTQESLAEIIARVESGETVVVARGGEVVARIEAVEHQEPRKPIDFESIRKLTENMTYQEESAGEFMRRLRDTDRY